MKWISVVAAIPLTVWLADQWHWPLWFAIVMAIIPVPVAVYFVLSAAFTLLVIPIAMRNRRRLGAASAPGGPARLGAEFLSLNAFGSKTPLIIALMEGLSLMDSDGWAKMAREAILDEDQGEDGLEAATSRATSLESVFVIQARRWAEQEAQRLAGLQPDEIFRVWVPRQNRKTPPDGLRAWVGVIVGRAAAALAVLDYMHPEEFGDLYAPLEEAVPFNALVARGQELHAARG